MKAMFMVNSILLHIIIFICILCGFNAFYINNKLKNIPIYSITRDKLNGDGILQNDQTIHTSKQLNKQPESSNNNRDNSEEEIESSLYDSFNPILDNKKRINFDEIDFEKLKPDDPIFLEMTWPTKPGPAATAFAKHMQWKRQLSDLERLRWQKWAVYERLLTKETFDYSVEDYVFQNMLRDIDKRKFNYNKQLNSNEAMLWDEISYIYKNNEELQINNTIKALYKAINNKNVDSVKTLWLPSGSSELCIPGYEKVIGYNDVEKFYKKLITDLKYVGSINHEIVSIDVWGYVAIAQIIETVDAGKSLKIAKKKSRSAGPSSYKVPASNPPPIKKIITTIVLRKWNKQWRVSSQHASPFVYSEFTNNAKIYIKPSKSNSNNIESTDKSKFPIVKELGVKDKPFNDFNVNDLTEIKGRLVRIAKDGSLYVDNTKTETITPPTWDKIFNEANVVSVSIKDGLIEVNDFNEEEIKIEDYIDVEASTSKQTILALRYLEKSNKINKDVKDLLVMDIINCISKEETSLIETSFEILVLKANPAIVSKSNVNDKNNKLLNMITSTNNNRKSSPSGLVKATKDLVTECLSEFAFQCVQIYNTLIKLNNNKISKELSKGSYLIDDDIVDDDLDDDNDDDDDDDDDEESIDNNNYNSKRKKWNTVINNNKKKFLYNFKNNLLSRKKNQSDNDN